MTTGRRRADSSGEDELLSRLYQQVTEQQAARFAEGYDMAAGLDRYRAWLDEHTAEEQARPQAIRSAERAAQEQARPRAIPVARPATLRAAFADSGVRAVAISELLVAGGTSTGASSGTPADWNAEQAVTALYSTHYRSLVRLAALLVRDTATAEEVVQDSFIALHTAWRRLPDMEMAVSYLRQAVVNRSRSVLRQREMVDPNAPKPGPDRPSAERGALTLMERTAVVAALRALPTRQREVLVLRYYGDLSEAQIASAMGISRGAVKTHMARAIASLRAVLELET